MRLTGTDLDEWARRRAAEGELPELVRRLIYATLDDRDLVRLVVPADEGISKTGVDGWVETREGNTFVPRGASAWEVGRGKDPEKKAQADYRARTITRPPPGVDLEQTTFVFVTPRRWAVHADWELKRRDEKLWRDVRVYDADALVDWLHRAPAVWAWFAELIGRPGPLRSLEWCWREWSLTTDPPSSEGLVLAGREVQRERLMVWLSRPASALQVQAADPDEVAAFCWAALQRMPGEQQREAWLARALVVSGDDELRRLALEPRPLLLVARDCRLDIARVAAAAGHHVILASSARAVRGSLDLGLLDPQRAQVELERMGLLPEYARKLILEVRGALPGGAGVSTAAVRRKLGALGDELPEQLAPLVLVGAWTDQAEDARAVCAILGDGPERLRDLQRRYSGQPDSPLVRVGDAWRWTSRRDAWRQLGRRLQPAEIDKFAEVFNDIFNTDGPRGSNELRRGLLEGLVLLAVEDDALPQGHDRELPERIVSRLLRSRDSVEHWTALGGSLALLAEAGPESFLQCARRALRTDSGSSVPSDLIGALEVLVWPEEHFYTATELLARIVSSAEQAAVGEQALQSLCEIYRPWQPHTAARREVRAAGLDALANQHSGVAVKLMLELLPSSLGDVSMGTRRPRYRDWADAVTHEDVESDKDIGQDYLGFCDRLLELGRCDASHWLVIVPKIEKLSLGDRLAAVDALSKLDDSQLSATQLEELRRQIRGVIHLHRQFADSKWSMAESELEQLEALHERLSPDDVRDEVAWLFDMAPALLNAPPFDASGAETLAANEHAQRSVALRLNAQLSSTELVAFSERVGDPRALGFALGSIIDSESQIVELLNASVAEEHPRARDLRRGLGSALFRHSGFGAWDTQAIAALPDRVKADLLRGYPSNAAVWDVVEALGSEVADDYWGEAGLLYPHDPKDFERVVRSLLRVGRSRAAAKLAASARATGFASLHPSFSVELLDAVSQASEEEPDADVRLSNFLIHELLSQLREDGAQWRDELRRLEWALLPIFDFHRHHPHALYEALADEPEYYAAMLQRAYPSLHLAGDDDAARASKLIFHWRLLPGAHNDGSIDVARLRAWLQTARPALRELQLSINGDYQLGEVLGNSPEGSDGQWPHEAVRDVFEELGDAERIEAGLITGRRNRLSQRLSLVDPDRDQKHADKLREDAKTMRTRWPNIARVLEHLARASEGDARFWTDSRRRDQDHTPPATTTHRVEAYLDDLQAQGRYVFDLDALEQGIGDQPDILRVLADLPSVAQICEDAYVIVRPEYRRLGAPPPSWYIDAIMTRAKQRYCVGLLSAAALHGAADQQPQLFQVLVEHPRDPAKVGAHTIEFVAREREQDFRSEQLNTETGVMLVATPEATVFDLSEFSDDCGGHDAVISVLEELGEDLQAERLYDVATAYPPWVIEKAAAMLDEAGHGQLAQSLRQHPSPQPVLGAQ